MTQAAGFYSNRRIEEMYSRPSLSLEFDRYAEGIASVIKRKASTGAFVVGVTGPWGSGKTTLMQATVERLPPPTFTNVYFNAWAHSKRDEVWRALFLAVTAKVREKFVALNRDGAYVAKDPEHLQAIADVERSLYSAFSREERGQVELDGGKLAKAGVKLALKFIPGGDLASGLFDLFSPAKESGSSSKDIGESNKTTSRDYLMSSPGL
jgi:hypothetical protein